MIAKFFTVADRVLVVIACVAIFVMLTITTVSVIGRYVVGEPIPDDIVMNELLIVFLVFLPIAFVQRMKQHVFVTLFTDWLPGRWQLVCETIGNLVGLIIFTLLAYATFQDFWEAYEVLAYNEGPLELPEYPSRFAVFFGILVMALRLAYDFIDGLINIAKGNEIVKVEGGH